MRKLGTFIILFIILGSFLFSNLYKFGLDTDDVWFSNQNKSLGLYDGNIILVDDGNGNYTVGDIVSAYVTFHPEIESPDDYFLKVVDTQYEYDTNTV